MVSWLLKLFEGETMMKMEICELFEEDINYGKIALDRINTLAEPELIKRDKRLLTKLEQAMNNDNSEIPRISTKEDELFSDLSGMIKFRTLKNVKMSIRMINDHIKRDQAVGKLVKPEKKSYQLEQPVNDYFPAFNLTKHKKDWKKLNKTKFYKN